MKDLIVGKDAVLDKALEILNSGKVLNKKIKYQFITAPNIIAAIWADSHILSIISLPIFSHKLTRY